MHYQRQRKTGHVGNDDPTVMRYQKIEQWIEYAAGYAEDDCLKWPFARTSRGYACTRKTTVPRLILERVVGPPPNGEYQAAHSCGKGHEGCVNPRHLRWASPLSNAADRVIHGTNLYGQKSPASKMTEKQVLEIRGDRRSGMTYKDIAQKHLCSVGCVRGITSGTNWSWLADA